MEIAAREIHDGTIGCDLNAKLPLSDTTWGKRAFAPPEVFKNIFSLRYNRLQTFCYPLKISAGCGPVCGNGWIIERNVLANLRNAPCFEIQFDEKTDLTNDFPLHWQAQLISHVRFPDKEPMKVVD